MPFYAVTSNRRKAEQLARHFSPLEVLPSLPPEIKHPFPEVIAYYKALSANVVGAIADDRALFLPDLPGPDVKPFLSPEVFDTLFQGKEGLLTYALAISFPKAISTLTRSLGVRIVPPHPGDVWPPLGERLAVLPSTKPLTLYSKEELQELEERLDALLFKPFHTFATASLGRPLAPHPRDGERFLNLPNTFPQGPYPSFREGLSAKAPLPAVASFLSAVAPVLSPPPGEPRSPIPLHLSSFSLPLEGLERELEEHRRAYEALLKEFSLSPRCPSQPVEVEREGELFALYANGERVAVAIPQRMPPILEELLAKEGVEATLYMPLSACPSAIPTLMELLPKEVVAIFPYTPAFLPHRMPAGFYPSAIASNGPFAPPTFYLSNVASPFLHFILEPLHAHSLPSLAKVRGAP